MKNYNFLYLSLISLTLFLGGLGVGKEYIKYLGIAVPIILLIVAWVRNRRILFPNFFLLYCLFLILFLINSFIVSIDIKKSLEVFSLFLGGGLFWLAFYNFRSECVDKFTYLIIFLGLVLGFLSHFYELFGLKKISPWSLYAQASSYTNHNHIGDLWAMVLLIVVFYLMNDPKRLFYWFLGALGVYFLIISESRTALVSLAAGIFYLAGSYGWLEKYKKIFVSIFVLLCILFLYFGSQKSILSSRPYYIEGVIGFFRNPQGVGVGNFEYISKDTANRILGFSGFSTIAHNIVLEVLTGMGVLGLVFVYWLYKVIVEIWRTSDKGSRIYAALFLALTANFFFDTTYFIPTMLWLWFATLGFAQVRVKS